MLKRPMLNILIPRILIPTLILVTILCYPSHLSHPVFAGDNRIPLDVQNILWWFPEDTETATVARGPFKVKVFDQPPDSVDLPEAFRQGATAGLLVLKRGKFSKYINGQTILLSVEGSRKFLPPTSLGGMRYEGCSVTCFDRDFESQRESLLKALQADAKQVKNISGHQVFLFNEKLEDDWLNFFVTFPREDTVLCATNEKFLVEMFSRLNKIEGKRALPQNLPEWGSVDVQAPFWGIRHYSRTGYDEDPSSPLAEEIGGFNIRDKQAIGLTYVYDPRRANELRIKYLTGNKDADRLVDSYWNMPESEAKPQVQKNPLGVDIVFVFHKDVDPLYAWFLLRGALGQGVFL